MRKCKIIVYMGTRVCLVVRVFTNNWDDLISIPPSVFSFISSHIDRYDQKTQKESAVCPYKELFSNVFHLENTIIIFLDHLNIKYKIKGESIGYVLHGCNSLQKGPG